MFFQFIFFVISAIFGFFAVKKFTDFTTKEESIIYGLIFGLICNCASIYFIARVIGLSSISILVPQAALIVISAYLYFSESKLKLEMNKKVFLAILTILFFSFTLFVPIFVTHSLQKVGNSLNSGITEWGDLALHTTLINYFVNNPTSLSRNPIYSGSNLAYPPLIDFTSAVFVWMGSSLQQSLYFPAIILSVLFTLEVFLLTYELTRKIATSAISVVLVLFNGGLGFLYFVNDYFVSHQGFFYFISHLHKDYAKLTDQGIQLGNIIVVSLIPQRTFLLGYTAGLMVIILIYRYFKTHNKGNLAFAGIITGTLPLIHPHSLIAVAIFCTVMVLMNLKLKIIVDFLKFFIPPAIMISAFPIFEILTSLNIKSGFLRVQLFWMADKTNPLLFYFNNLGIFLILLATSLFFVSRNLLKDIIPFFIIFLVANIFVFQPWDYDNTKILFYFMIGASVLVASILASLLYTKYNLAKIATVILIFFTVFSGVLSVLYESLSIYELYNVQGIEFAQQVNSSTPQGSTILTSDEHNNPVTSFSGRQIVMGYRGWLWTWGYNYSQKERDVQEIYAGSPLAPALINKYGISYVVVGPSERTTFYANDNYFDNHYKLLLSLNDYKLYDAKTYTP